MASSNDGEIDARFQSGPLVPAQTVISDGLPDLSALAPTILESTEVHSNWLPSSTGDDAAQIVARRASEVEKQPVLSDTRVIYVDYAVPATLSYSETVVIYLTLREAITAWLALSNEVKKDASITTNENGGARYTGWEIYRLWGRWDT